MRRGSKPSSILSASCPPLRCSDPSLGLLGSQLSVVVSQPQLLKNDTFPEASVTSWSLHRCRGVEGCNLPLPSSPMLDFPAWPNLSLLVAVEVQNFTSQGLDLLLNPNAMIPHSLLSTAKKYQAMSRDSCRYQNTCPFK